MIKNILIVRGVSSTDDLRALGLPMAQQYDEADVVIAVSSGGKSIALKNRGETNKDLLQVTFVDGDSQIVEFAKIINEVDKAYGDAHKDEIHLSQAFVGMWLFFWMGRGDEMKPTPIEMAQHGDIEGLRASARTFIESDFGNNVRAPDRISSDEVSDTATA